MRTLSIWELDLKVEEPKPRPRIRSARARKLKAAIHFKPSIRFHKKAKYLGTQKQNKLMFPVGGAKFKLEDKNDSVQK